MTRLSLLILLFALTIHAQTVELYQLPLADLQAKADKGDAAAQVQLSIRNKHGIGLPLSTEKAQACMEQAAAAGDLTALGICELRGWGREMDQLSAYRHLEKAAAKGDLIAMSFGGYYLVKNSTFPEDIARGIEWLQLSAQGGDCEGMWNLGRCYGQGVGVKKDYTKAVEWFTRASEHNHPQATCILGICYESGIGVMEDMEKARQLYQKAVSLGHDFAQTKLNEMKSHIHSTGRSE